MPFADSRRMHECDQIANQMDGAVARPRECAGDAVRLAPAGRWLNPMRRVSAVGRRQGIGLGSGVERYMTLVMRG